MAKKQGWHGERRNHGLCAKGIKVRPEKMKASGKKSGSLIKMKKFLIALPSFPNAKGFSHPTILVSARDEEDAINLVYHLKGNRINIGDIKEVDY